MKKLEEYVVSIPDFPEPGIIFRDVTSILQDADGLQLAIDGLLESLKDVEYDVVVGPESRGFIFGVPVAYEAHKSFVPVRKKGKLPRETLHAEYDLEYGSAFYALVEPGNKASPGLLRKLGFRFTGQECNGSRHRYCLGARCL